MRSMLSVGMFLLCAGSVPGSVRYVAPGGQNSQVSGSTAQNPYLTIQYALNQAYPDNNIIIYVKSGDYFETQQYLSFGANLSGKTVSLFGYSEVPGDEPSGAARPRFTGTNESRTVYANVDVNVTLKHMVFSGSVLSAGGMIVQWESRGSLMIENCTVGLPDATAIGIWVHQDGGIARTISVRNSVINCRHHGIYVGSAGLFQLTNCLVESFSPLEYAHLIMISGTTGDASNQTIRTVISGNTFRTPSANIRISAVIGEKCDYARQFEVTNNDFLVRTWGTCVSITNCIPVFRIENNRGRAQNYSATWTMINLGSDAEPQSPVSNVSFKTDRGNGLVRNNWLEQTFTVIPQIIGKGTTNGIDNGHCILIGQGIDQVDVSGNTCLGADISLVIKGEANHVHHNFVAGGVPILIKGGQGNIVHNNSCYHNQNPAGAGCLDVQDKSDPASGLQAYHPSKACQNRIFDNIFMVAPDLNDFCVVDNPVGGFMPLGQDVYVNCNLYFAPGSTNFALLGGAIRTKFSQYKAAWKNYSAMFGDNDSRSYYGDPKFVDPLRGDFRLQAGSAALGRGSVMGTNIGASQLLPVAMSAVIPVTPPIGDE